MKDQSLTLPLCQQVPKGVGRDREETATQYQSPHRHHRRRHRHHHHHLLLLHGIPHPQEQPRLCHEGEK